MPTSSIRVMRAEDLPAVATLFREMQAHYRVPCPPEAAILHDLACLPAGTTILVAGTPHLVGFASLCAIYPGPGLKAGLFLKELFVSERARDAGLGRKLLRAAARFAQEHGFSRIDWTADRENAPLLGFYERTGAAPQPDKLFFRLTGDALAGLAAGTDGD